MTDDERKEFWQHICSKAYRRIGIESTRILSPENGRLYPSDFNTLEGLVKFISTVEDMKLPKSVEAKKTKSKK